jgi:ADP-ribosylglycohydrolase
MHSRIARVLRAYAAGDAFGVHYEFREVESVTSELRALDGWPYGGVSDDSLLTLLTLATLTEETPEKAAEKFLSDLKAAAPSLRGLGPTTRNALGMSVKESEIHLIGKSNGAMMRTALCGLAFSAEQASLRREYVGALARATHSSDEAIVCAQIAAALFASPDLEIDEVFAAEISVHGVVLGDRKSWQSPKSGISLDPVETLFAFMMVAERNTKVIDAYMDACSLGGDTDTVSALAGSLVALRNSDSGFDHIPWLSDIDWKEISSLDQIALTLSGGN